MWREPIRETNFFTPPTKISIPIDRHPLTQGLSTTPRTIMEIENVNSMLQSAALNTAATIWKGPTEHIPIDNVNGDCVAVSSTGDDVTSPSARGGHDLLLNSEETINYVPCDNKNEGVANFSPIGNDGTSPRIGSVSDGHSDI